MKTMETDELGEKISEVLREVEENGQAVEITRQGKVVARMVPVHSEQTIDRDANGAWSELVRLIDVIGSQWPEGVSAQDAINDVRRDL